MTEAEYTALIEAEPDLNLPPYWLLHHSFREKIAPMPVQQLSAARRNAMVRRALLGEKLHDWNTRDGNTVTELEYQMTLNPQMIPEA